jgi:Holliday junction resolvase
MWTIFKRILGRATWHEMVSLEGDSSDAQPIITFSGIFGARQIVAVASTQPRWLRIDPRLDEIDERTISEAAKGFYESRLKIEISVWQKGKALSEYRE